MHDPELEAAGIEGADHLRKQAKEGDALQFCPECDGNTYLGRIGVDERTCPTCKGKGLIDKQTGGLKG